MKSKNTNRKADYYLIKRKLYSYIFIAIITAVVFVVLLREFIQQQGVVGNWIVSFLISALHIGSQDAIKIYNFAIRGNMEIIICVAVAICFFIICRIIFSKFMKYFDEVNAGIDLLIQGENTQIGLSMEMAFMEQKLNTLRQTLEKREREVKQAEQRKNDLVTYLAHDIKTPLTSVIGYLSLLDEAPDMPIEQKVKYIHIGLEKAYRLENLINEFFEITRYNLQTMTLSKKDIDLYYMLMQLTDEAYPQLAAHGKKAVIHAPENLIVYGDSDKLARAFNNILKNAIVYGDDNSVIDITANIKNNAVVIEFRNYGSIPRDKLLTIFDKFYRLDDARSSGTGGTGLGLAIAKEIVLLHGGGIKAESENGCTIFRIELPVNEIKEI